MAFVLVPLPGTPVDVLAGPYSDDETRARPSEDLGMTALVVEQGTGGAKRLHASGLVRHHPVLDGGDLGTQTADRVGVMLETSEWASSPAGGDRPVSGRGARGRDPGRADVGPRRVRSGSDPRTAQGPEEPGRPAYLFISHDLAVVRQISDRVAVMYAGAVVEFGNTAQVLGEPRPWYTKALLAAVPSMDPRTRDSAGAVTPAAPAGSAGSVSAPVASWTFATRCPNANDVCLTSHPPLADDGGGHLVACHRPNRARVEDGSSA